MPISARSIASATCALAGIVLLTACSPALRTDVDATAPVTGVPAPIEDAREISALRAELANPDPAARADAARMLRRARPFALVEPGLIAALSDPQADVRLAAVETLTRPLRSDAAAEPLLRLLGDPDMRVRTAATLAIRDFRVEAQTALPGVIDRALHGDDAGRRLAAEQLQFLWPALDDETFAMVAGLLDDPDRRIREIAAHTVNKALVVRRTVGLDDRTKALVAKLTTALSDGSSDVRRDAAHALEALGTAAASSWPALEAGVRSEPDREAGLAMELAARSVDAAGRGGLSQVGTTVWTDVSACLPGAETEIAGLSPRDPDSALTRLAADPISLTAREGWSLSGAYAVIRHHYPGFTVDIADGGIERLESHDPAEAMPNGLRAGLSRDEVIGILGVDVTPRMRSAGLFRLNLCDPGAIGSSVEIEFDAFDTVSEISASTSVY